MEKRGKEKCRKRNRKKEKRRKRNRKKEKKERKRMGFNFLNVSKLHEKDKEKERLEREK